MILQLIDSFGRMISSARISVNSICNFKCIFCHNEGISKNENILLKPEEIERIVRILFKYNIDSVKLTGGEPMLRNDIVEIVKRIKNIGIRDISMTTNGTRFYEFAKELKDAGLNRVNISMHSLNPKTYNFITNINKYDEMLKAIDAALEYKIIPLKLNVVVLKNVNDNEINDFINYIAKLNKKGEVILQLIELVAIGSASESTFFKKYHLNLSEIENMIIKKAIKTEIRSLHKRKKYYLSNGAIIEFVKPMHNTEFCMNCNRIRITYDGKFKPCLLRDDNHIDFIEALRNGASDKEIEKILKKAISLREPFFKPSKEMEIKPKVFYACTE